MTIKEIASLAGVSISTVSKIVNNKADGINPQTISRVLQIVKEYNYSPYSAIRSCNGAKRFVLAVILREALTSAALLNGILRTAQQAGYSIQLFDSGLDPDTEKKHIAAVCAGGADGVIWEPVAESSLFSYEDFEHQNLPCLILGDAAGSSSGLDYAAFGYALTEKLISCGHTSLFCFGGRTGRIEDRTAFCEGFRRCLFEHQLPAPNTAEEALPAAEISRGIFEKKITGVLCFDEEDALELRGELAKKQYRLPQDYSLLCLKRPDRMISSGISGIILPLYELGAHIAEELIARCEKTESSAPGSFSCGFELDHEQSLAQPSDLQRQRFVVIGAINMDMTFTVDHLPRHGDTAIIRNAQASAGGKGCNQAIGIAKLGHEAALIGELGADTDAAFLFDVLSRNHVFAQGVLRDRYKPTGKAYIYKEEDGESAISILPGANSSLRPDDIDERSSLFSRASYCLISTELRYETVIRAAQLARRHGLTTIVKPSAISTLRPELLSNTDIFIPNRKEAALLGPSYSTVEEQAEYFLQLGPKIVIITLGHRGCYLRTKKTAGFYPAADVTAIDTTGGADAFITALACFLSEGTPLEEAVRIATAAAGHCVSRQGTEQALIDREALERLML